jgi:uncharacterized iron-regulated membrane protein
MQDQSVEVENGAMAGLLALEIVSHLAAIATGVVAVAAYWMYLHDRKAKRLRLEKHLREEKERDTDHGQRTLLHLVARLGMSEGEIMDAAFRSKVIARRVATDKDGRANMLFLEYKGNDVPEPQRF